MIFNIGGAMDVSAKRLPKFRIVANGQTFENAGEVKSEPGVYELIQTDAAKNHWYLKLLCNCTFTPLSKFPETEAYVLGGGAGGADMFGAKADGGSGGNSATDQIAAIKGSTITVTVGAGGTHGKDGAPSSIGSLTASGGKTGAGGKATGAGLVDWNYTGRVDGGDGEDGAYPFGDALAGNRYGAGGGGTHGYLSNYNYAKLGRKGHGGSDGGGDAGELWAEWGGGSYPTPNQSEGNPGTDYGAGGGGGNPGGAGYQGIVILRNKR